MLDCLTIGGIKIDTFVFLDAATIARQGKKKISMLCLPYGEKLTIEKHATQTAGSAPNVATGLQRLGMRSGIYSILGQDPAADLARETLKREKVSLKYLAYKKASVTSFSLVLLHKGERTMLTSHTRDRYHLRVKPDAKWLYLSEMGEGFEALYADVVRHASKKKGPSIAFNPGTIQVRAGYKKLKALLKQTDILFVNKEEGHELLQEKNQLDTPHLIRMLWKIGPSVVVVTDGRAGAYAFEGGEIYHAPMFPGDRIEATGAGDGFATGFLGARMQGKHLRDALAWGSVNGASVVHEVGPTKGLLARAQIARRLREHPRYTIKSV
jgi:ribokinase